MLLTTTSADHHLIPEYTSLPMLCDQLWADHIWMHNSWLLYGQLCADQNPIPECITSDCSVINHGLVTTRYLKESLWLVQWQTLGWDYLLKIYFNLLFSIVNHWAAVLIYSKKKLAELLQNSLPPKACVNP